MRFIARYVFSVKEGQMLISLHKPVHVSIKPKLSGLLERLSKTSNTQ